MNEQTIEYDDKTLRQLIKAFGKPPTVRVGVIGKNGRSGDQSNATIGAKHEFGDHEVPQRSFLRMPLIEYFASYLDKSQLLGEESLKNTARMGSLELLMKAVGVIAETVIQEAFATGGFGKWKAWSGGYQSRTGMILVDTQQLRNSISSEVKK